VNLFEIVAGVCSILSLIVSLFVAQRVIKIGNQVRVKGEHNVVAGGDIRP